MGKNQPYLSKIHRIQMEQMMTAVHCLHFNNVKLPLARMEVIFL
jgi:hypothetical protein